MAAGTGGLTKAGTGQMTLTGNNTFSGGTTVDGGTLTLQGAGSNLSSTGLVTVNAPAILEINGDETIGALAGTGAGAEVTLTSGTLTTGDATDTTYEGAITGVGDLVKNGTGTFTATGDISNGTVTVNGGTLVLTGTNSMSQITVDGAGELVLGSDNAAGGAAGLIRTTGSVITYADTVNSATAIEIASDTTQVNVEAADAAEQSGVISEDAAGRPLEKIGTGTLTLSGTNTFTGDLTITGGTLAVTGGAAIADVVEVVVGTGATFRVDSDESIGALSSTAADATVAVGVNTLSVVGTQDTTYAGTMTGTGSLFNGGTGTLTLTGDGSGFTGVLGSTNAGAEVAITGGGTTGANGVGAVVGSTLSTDGGAILTSNAILAADGQVTFTGDETIGTLVNGAASGVAGGTVTLTGAGTVLTVNGSANLLNPGTFNGTNGTIDGTGSLNITGGTFSVGAAGDVQTATTIGAGGTVVNGGTMADVGNAGTFTNNGTADDLTNTGAGAGSNAGTLASLTHNSTGTFTNTGVVTGNTAVSSGIVNLNAGTNLSDTGSVTMTGGTLNVNAAETVGALVANAGTTNVNAQLNAGEVSGTAGSIVLGAAGGLVAGDSDGSSTSFGGVISGTGFVQKLGTDTQTLTGVNTFTGGITATQGVLAITGSGSVLNTGFITIDPAGSVSTDGGAFANTLSITNNGAPVGGFGLLLTGGGDESIASMSGTGTTNLSSGSVLTLNTGASAIGGAISGAGALTVTGTSATTLTAANTYTGATTVNSGTLAVTGAGSVASADVTVTGTGALTTDSDALGAASVVTVSGTGTFTSSGTDSFAAITQTGGTVNGSGVETLSGAFTQSGGTTGGTVDINSATFTQSGGAIIAAGTTVTSSGVQALNGGTIAGALDGAGAITAASGTTGVTGTITNAASLTVSGGTVNLTGAGSVDTGGNAIAVSAGALTNDGGGIGDTDTVTVSGTGTLTTTGTDTIAALTQTGGIVNGSSTLTSTGAFTQSGGTTGGTITVVAGSFTQSGGAAIAAGTTVTTAGAKTLNGGSIAGTLNGTGAFNVASNTTTVTGAITGAASGTVATGATLTSTGTVSTTGTLTNNGTANMAGLVSGNLVGTLDDGIVNNSTFNVTGLLTGNGSGFTNTAAGDILNVTGGNFTNVGNIVNGGTINVTGRTLGGNVTSNTGLVVLTSGTIAGAFTNAAAGDIRVSGAGNAITGGLTNNGEVLMNDADAADVLAVTGTLTGGAYQINTDLSAGTADRVNVAGNVAGTLTFLAADLDDVFTLGDRATILTANNAAAAFAANQFVLASSGGAVVTLLENTGTNLEIVAQTSSGIGGIAANAAIIQSLISSVVNRPSSPFTGGLAAEEGCFHGGYARGTIGKATADGSTNNGVRDSATSVSATWAGAQAGYDFGCNDGRFFDGWDGSVGALIGYNKGSSDQDVLLPGAGGGDIVASRTLTDFEQTYVGIYAAGSKDKLTADVQLRFDRTKFDLSEVAVGGTPLGVDGRSFDTNSTNLTARVSYNVSLNDKGLAFVPTAGFSLTRTSSATLAVGGAVDPNDGTLTLDAFNSNVGFIGGTLVKSTISEDGTSANAYFVSGNYYQDFAGDRTATFAANSGDVTNITIDNLGGFGEASLGWNYIKILEDGPGGARQLNASIRGDARFGENISDSLSLTAQLRLTF